MGAKHVDMIVEDSHVYLVSFVSVLSFVSTNDRGSPITKLEPTGSSTLPPPRALASAIHGSSPSSNPSSRNSQATNLEHKARKTLSR